MPKLRHPSLVEARAFLTLKPLSADELVLLRSLYQHDEKVSERVIREQMESQGLGSDVRATFTKLQERGFALECECVVFLDSYSIRFHEMPETLKMAMADEKLV
jgi:hypothetical protein